MALVATRVVPAGPELYPRGNGHFAEFWKLVGDGSDVDVAITVETFTIVDAASGCTASVAISGNIVTLTHATALGNGLIEYVEIIGRR